MFRKKGYLSSDLREMSNRHAYLDEENSRHKEGPVQIHGGGHVPGMFERQQGGQHGSRGVSKRKKGKESREQVDRWCWII